ncbi:thioredoxin family protein [Ideonella sp. 4Y16]|uniref:Thioredoxin family protein n=1 Tax=Ideonella alba TaxID=2824118 RepID=A0A940YFV9_9BURK|nr:thioredoxin family protein [Ideonella alba]MBQ0933413.1 thioredoxin family protein [Ideonella alba]MBQ0943542.1 thioredoxin family protein [Ideonella alba]
MTAAPQLLVACLCAGWCTTCDAYRATFDALADRHPQARFVWVDIEDHADALEDDDGHAPDIQNFPTLLLVQDGTPRFFGTVLPHAAVVERMLAEAARAALPRLSDAGSQVLARAVLALQHSGALD